MSYITWQFFRRRTVFGTVFFTYTDRHSSPLCTGWPKNSTIFKSLWRSCIRWCRKAIRIFKCSYIVWNKVVVSNFIRVQYSLHYAKIIIHIHVLRSTRVYWSKKTCHQAGRTSALLISHSGELCGKTVSSKDPRRWLYEVHSVTVLDQISQDTKNRRQTDC